MVGPYNGSSRLTLETAIRTRSLAFSVADSLSTLCTHEHWLRMLAISKRYLLMPALSTVSWKSTSWVRGVQAATTIRFNLCSLMTWVIFSCVSWEQLKRFSSAKATPARVLAYSTTFETSRKPAILVPQQHTNTPILGGSPLTSISCGISLVFVKVPLDSASVLAAAAAEALDSMTDWGISLGPSKVPQTNMPGLDVWTGSKLLVNACWYWSSSIPIFSARSRASSDTLKPTDRTTISNSSSTIIPVSSL